MSRPEINITIKEVEIPTKCLQYSWKMTQDGKDYGDSTWTTQEIDLTEYYRNILKRCQEL